MNRLLVRTARNIRVPRGTRTPMRRFVSEDVGKNTALGDKFYQFYRDTQLGASFLGGGIGSIYGYNKYNVNVEDIIFYGAAGGLAGLVWPVILPVGIYYVYDTYGRLNEIKMGM